MDERTRILLCEDDESLGMLLREYLQQKGFSADLFADGESGYKAFLKGKYDICVLDVMMPKKDGFALAQEIRSVNSEVPIIFLTAKSLKEDILEGFKIGADDYITKPFHADMLLARIDSLIRQRESLRQSFRKDVSLEPSSVTATPVDEKFIRSCIENIEEHISDLDYGVDDLCANIGYSRPQLYRKIKSITGMTAIQFVRGIRLKRAAQLLSSDPGKSVSQVMYAVGFNNISYFSKIFFAEFGVLPKDYKSAGKEA